MNCIRYIDSKSLICETGNVDRGAGTGVSQAVRRIFKGLEGILEFEERSIWEKS